MSGRLDIRFRVDGDPVPKGNHAGFPIARGRCTCGGRGCARRNCFGGTLVGVSITDDGGAELKAWEAFVRVQAISARNVAGARMVTRPGALEIRLVFMVERPSGHWLKSGQLSADGQRKPMPTSKPDFDKLARAAVDGLTDALVEDDAQVVTARVAKVWAPRAGLLARARAIASADGWVIDELAAHAIQYVESAQEALL